MQVAAVATAVPETVSSPSALFSFIFPPGFRFGAILYHFLAIFSLFSCFFVPTLSVSFPLMAAHG